MSLARKVSYWGSEDLNLRFGGASKILFCVKLTHCIQKVVRRAL